VAKRFSLNAIEDLLASVGFGRVTSGQVFSRLLGEREWEKKRRELRDRLKQQRKTTTEEPVLRRQGVVVTGVDNLLIRMARCCNPVPGDPIVGYITRGRGLSVHRVDCPNVTELASEQGRGVAVYWDGAEASSYPVDIEVEAVDRVNLLATIMNTVSEAKTNIKAVNARTTKDRRAIINLTIDIQDVEHMKRIMDLIGRVDGVRNVYRANPT
jgi:GTP pyrophosphokinase